jgi:Bacteriophage Lambda NinG protein
MASQSTQQHKESTCKVCSSKFVKTRPLQKVCGIECAKAIAKLKNFEARKKAERKELKERKEAILTRSDWIKKAQVAFNSFVRARDAGKPCISCGAPLAREAVGGAFDCGHYRSVGSAPHLRFNEDNAHGQCKQCNRYLSGNAVEYRRGLLTRLGHERIEQLEADQCVRKYTIEGLKTIVTQYRSATKQLMGGLNGL